MNKLNLHGSGERRLTFSQHLHGKYLAAQTLAGFMYHMSNWSEVWKAYRSADPIPVPHLRNGMKLIYGPNDDAIFSFREMFIGKPYTASGFYKPAANQTVIDIGANIGWFALFLQSRAKGIAIHCFEPARPALKCLRANVEANGFGEFISIHPYAVAGSNGRAALARHPHSVERRLLNECESAEGADVVETVTFERALAMTGAESVDLLKIDVEGAEVEIVAGSDIQSWRCVKRIALEYHEYLRPGCREALVQALKQRGFGNIWVNPAEGHPEQGIMFASQSG